MTIHSSYIDGGAVLFMAGSMRGTDFSQLHRELVELLRTRRSNIVLDFRGVDHVSYRDAHELAREFDLVRSYQGDLKVAGLSPYVRDILAAAGLYGFLETDTLDSDGVHRPGPARVPRAS